MVAASFGRGANETARLLRIIPLSVSIPVLLLLPCASGGGALTAVEARVVFDERPNSKASEAAAQEIETFKLDLQSVNTRTKEIGNKVDEVQT
jgi:hypothetical protein